MALPGFNAESSLYRNTHHYTKSQISPRGETRGVLPADHCEDMLNSCMDGCWKEDPNAKLGCQLGCSISYWLCH